ncbi:MAG: hypothetical protein LUD12_16855 [Lachnospiraceae bacterium]|nr:hypothetical protein [Lachnospiraceae bacterium]
MEKELTPEEKAAVELEFDRYMKEAILSEGNKLREEEGLPPLTMEELHEAAGKAEEKE